MVNFDLTKTFGVIFSSWAITAPHNNRDASQTTLHVSKESAVEADAQHDLLPLLQRAIPGASSYTSIDTVSQANAEGKRVAVQYEQPGTGSTTTAQLFVKQVDASKYCHKPWADLRRTLLYARTEIRFYKEILPAMKSKGFLDQYPLAPKCHLAEYNLNGLVDDNAHVLDVSNDSPSGYDDNSLELSTGRGGTLVLDSLCGNHYYQESPLTQKQASKCLSALAKLHACAWQEEDMLQIAEDRLSKTVYHLPMRNPQELIGMEQSWNDFMNEFAALAPDTFSKPNIKSLGKRMVRMAHYISEELSPQPNDDYVTICHGDYKAMNVFLPFKEENDAIMIDFASVGVGYGMCDVAMHLTHAVHPDNLKGGQEERLVNGYLDELETFFAGKKKNGSSKQHFSYPRDVALRHYRLEVVDYFRFILGRFWKGATPSAFEKRKDNKNTVLVNRNVEAAIALIEKVDGYLEEFELEHKSRG